MKYFSLQYDTDHLGAGGTIFVIAPAAIPPIVGSAGVPGQESVSSPLLGSSPTTRGAPGSLVGPGVILLKMFRRYYLAEITKSRVLCPSS